MRKIAIITVRDIYNSYDDCDRIIDKITDFEEVTDEIFEKLNKAQWEFGFSILEQPVDTGKFIATTIADYDALIEKRAEEKRKADEYSRKKGLEAKKKKELAAKAKEKEALKKVLMHQVIMGYISQEDADKLLDKVK